MAGAGNIAAKMGCCPRQERSAVANGNGRDVGHGLTAENGCLGQEWHLALVLCSGVLHLP
jgi:hypothetical protein